MCLLMVGTACKSSTLMFLCLARKTFIKTLGGCNGAHASYRLLFGLLFLACCLALLFNFFCSQPALTEPPFCRTTRCPRP